MSIDFSQVKTITIPEGSVKKITDSTGNILWKKGPSWHTVWEGSKKIGYGGSTGSEILFNQKDFIDLVSLFKGMQKIDDLNKDTIKSTVFHCISILDRLKVISDTEGG